MPKFDAKKGLEIGLYTIGDHLFQAGLSHLSVKDRIDQILDLGKMADQAGLAIFQVGESHQEDFVSSAHLILLAAIASQTDKIKLASGATTISTGDPVQVFEQAATIDLLSRERMELVCGRSARVGNFKTQDYDLDQYEELFEEKFDRLLTINTQAFPSQVDKKEEGQSLVWPRPDRPEKGLPIWQANSGSLQSALQAARRGVPLHLMQVSGQVDYYQDLFQSYQEEAKAYGHGKLPIATASFMMVKDQRDQAIHKYLPKIKEGMAQTRTSYLDELEVKDVASVEHVLNIGSPASVVEKILNQYEHFHHDRYVAQVDFAGVSLDDIKETIDYLGEKIIPEVQKLSLIHI